MPIDCWRGDDVGFKMCPRSRRRCFERQELEEEEKRVEDGAGIAKSLVEALIGGDPDQRQ